MCAMQSPSDEASAAAGAYLRLLERKNRGTQLLPATSEGRGAAAADIGNGRGAGTDLPANAGRSAGQWAGAIIGAISVAWAGAWTIPLVKVAAAAIWNGTMTSSLAIGLSIVSIPAAVVGTLGVIVVAGCSREIQRRKDLRAAAAARPAGASLADERESTGRDRGAERGTERTAEAPGPAPDRAVEEMGRGLIETIRSGQGGTAQELLSDFEDANGEVPEERIPLLATAIADRASLGNYEPASPHNELAAPVSLTQ
jgi:hypothetical protein